jgi:hypothetical protein
MLISKSVRPARKSGLHPMRVGMLSLASDVPDANEGDAFGSQGIATSDQNEADHHQDTAAQLQHVWWHFLPPCGG